MRSPNSAIPVAVNETSISRAKSLIVAEQVREDSVCDNNVNNVTGSVVLTQTASNDPDAYLESPPSVPKINLPDSELEYFAPLPLAKNTDVAGEVTTEITTNRLLPTAVTQHSALKLSTAEPSLMVLIKSKNYRQQIARYKTNLTQ
ncbi:MAG: hypothetical protein HC930_14170, partial [Hydrococcus sp. SU_1_0]|nr:hypothetical protein [Hydrococcus sp. SU_1_0]